MGIGCSKLFSKLKDIPTSFEGRNFEYVHCTAICVPFHLLEQFVSSNRNLAHTVHSFVGTGKST